MTTPQNPNVDQDNEHGHNLDISGSNNTIHIINNELESQQTSKTTAQKTFDEKRKISNYRPRFSFTCQLGIFLIIIIAGGGVLLLLSLMVTLSGERTLFSAIMDALSPRLTPISPYSPFYPN